MKKEVQGSRAAQAAPAEKTEFSLIPRVTLETLYANLLKGRMLDERLKPAGERREDGWAAVKAAAAAVLMDLSGDDVVAAAEEMPLVRVLRGEKTAVVVRDRQRPEAEGGRLLLHALGASLAHKTKKSGKVAVVFWRDVEQESWLDGLEIARTHALPVILVCPAKDEKHARPKANKLVPGTELPRMLVDGFDAVAVYRVAHEAIGRARSGRGATLVECAGFRMAGQRRHGDAVVNMERYLRGKGMLRKGMKEEILEEFARELSAAKKRARTDL